MNSEQVYAHLRTIMETERAEKAYFDYGTTMKGEPAAIADWNKLDKLDRQLEKMGVEIFWSDDYISCSNCGCIMPQTPGYYGDMLQWHLVGESEVLCLNCDKDGSGEIEYCMNDCERAVKHADPAEHGFTQTNDYHYENGFHPGQNDRPKDIVKKIDTKKLDYVFSISIADIGQFDVKFDLWVKEKE